MTTEPNKEALGSTEENRVSHYRLAGRSVVVFRGKLKRYRSLTFRKAVMWRRSQKT